LFNEPVAGFYTVCKSSDIPVGKARMFVINETMVDVFNIGGEFYALKNECPHAGASLAHGLIDGDEVACRIHHWRFSIRDGTYLDENKPKCNAQSFQVRVVEADLQVSVVTDGKRFGRPRNTEEFP